MEEYDEPIPGTPEGEYDLEDVNDFLAGVREVAQGLRETVQSSIAEDLSAGRGLAQTAEALVLGDINQTINDAGNVALKVATNVRKDISSDVDDAAATVIRSGFSVPVPDAQAYANRTGEYLPVAGVNDQVILALGAPNQREAVDVPGWEPRPVPVILPPGGAPVPPPTYRPVGIPQRYGGTWSLVCPDGWMSVAQDGPWYFCLEYKYYEYQIDPTKDPDNPNYVPPRGGTGGGGGWVEEPANPPAPTPGGTGPGPAPATGGTAGGGGSAPAPGGSGSTKPTGFIKLFSDQEGGFDIPAWPELDTPDACENIKAWLEMARLHAVRVSALVPALAVTVVAVPEWELIRSVVGLFGVDTSELGSATIIDKVFRWLDDAFENAALKLGYRIDLAVSPLIMRAVVNFLQRWLGDFCPEVTTQLTYAINTLIPSHLPTQSEADRGYLTGEFSDADWECLTKLNGTYRSWRKRIVHGERSKPTVHELIELYRRKRITKEGVDQRLRELGFTEANERQHLIALADAYPPFTDVIRMMVRDVADRGAVEKYKMDQGFEDKWQQPLKYYGEAQGISDEVARMYWRAHWHLPSPTALYEMVHRLRPGRVPADQVATKDDVKKALELDDMLPFWIDRMVAISYRPITRIDTQRAYELGTFDDAEVLERYQDMGYSPADSQILVRYSADLKKARRNRKLGMPTGTVLKSRYVKYLIDADEFAEQLGELGFTPPEIATIIRWGDRERKANGRKAVYTCTRGRFIKGLIDNATAQATLVRAGFQVNDVGVIVAEWCRTMETKSRELSASQLCDFFAKGLLNRQDYADALGRLGYGPEAVLRIMAACGIEIAEADKKAAAKAQKEFDKKLRDEARKKPRG